ncbi:G-protein coupled receptor moody [Drosophila grimshawi]|uniref:GH24406 n=1 Tax=Drosophila grimshawi TaxID=7222 RepID=B4JM25_DROGR|nr:G-protein coupled receptor moody [Drosophila grimshawi]XP_032594665.1 G-protein coupled receptor moody [Drosophila grimshawi]XP_032594666.1 G-protein coupled receptor moody [Drosophila grimshawi]EDV91786.1 GH24406 [Drosophila grimshawi]
MSDDTITASSLGYGDDFMPATPAIDSGLIDADESGFSQSLLTFAAVMTFLIMIVGIFGNFLTVVALLKCPKVRNVAAAFIISLCIADLLFCALVLPFQGLRFVQGTWRHGQVLCRLIPFIQYGNIGVSLLCIAMITINRYVMITHHGIYARIYKRHWIAVMIAACWLVSYGMQLPTLMGAWGRFGYDARLQTCSIMSDSHGHSSKTTLFITAFVIPCLVIIACYAKIFWVVHKSEQRLKRHAKKQNSIPNNLRGVAATTTTTAAAAAGLDNQSMQSNPNPAANSRVSSDSSSSYSSDVAVPPELNPSKQQQQQQQPTRVKDQREVRAKRNEWRITKMVLAIFLSFVICYLPITIVKVADKHVEHPSLHIFSYIMLYLSACINPIIYVIMNKQYRKAYKTVVLCQPARLLHPFGKTNGGASSAGEKWKDTGLSNNHSRTIVSQMSGGAAATATATAAAMAPKTISDCQPCHKQQQQQQPAMAMATATATALATPVPQSLELQSRCPDLLSRTNAKPLIMSPSPSLATPPPPSVMVAKLPPKRSNHSYINNGFNINSSSSNSSNTSSSLSNPSPVYRPGAGCPAPSSLRRITMVGDDIILEEEELPATPPSPSKITKAPIYMNVNSPKRMQMQMQSYSVNTNAPVKDALQQQDQQQQQQQQPDKDATSKVLITKFANPKD